MSYFMKSLFFFLEPGGWAPGDESKCLSLIIYFLITSFLLRTRICPPQCPGQAPVFQHYGHPVGWAWGAKWSCHRIQGTFFQDKRGFHFVRSNAIDMSSNYLSQCRRGESIHYPLDLRSSQSALRVIPFDWSLMWNVLNVLTAARWILSDFTPDLTGSILGREIGVEHK